jgi:alpha-beta hydrolase superfamily lysophospholipase
MKEWLIRLAVGAAVVVVLAIAASWMIAGTLSDPAHRDIGRPPLDMEASNITFASGSEVLIHGWLSHGKPGQGVVLLLHAIRGDRRDMLSRAEFLRSQGYSVLMIDFQSHGENRGNHITFGDLESRDVKGAIEYLRHKMPDEKVGVIGASMGAAAYVMSDDHPPVAAVVLEQMYSTISRAVTSQVRNYVGPFAPLVAPLVSIQAESRLGIPENRLRPIDRMSKLGVPVLIICGTEDKHTPIEDSRALFDAAHEPKELWAVAGAGHVNLQAFAKKEYERRVGEFLARYLRSPDPGRPPLTPGQ